MNPNLNKEINTKKVISVYDFDGTISNIDSFTSFLAYAYGNRSYYIKMISLLIPTLRYFSGSMSRSDLKAFLISRFLKGESSEWLSNKAKDFFDEKIDSLIRVGAIDQIKRDLHRGFHVAICSASPEFLLAPFAKFLNASLVCTRLETENGIFTGNILGKNCIAGEKVERLIDAYGPLDNFYLIGWGDSPGDYDFLSISQESNWRPFRNYVSPPPEYLSAIKIRNSKNY